MKILVTVVLVVVLGVIGLLLYVGWFLRRAVTDKTRVSAVVQQSGPGTLEIAVTSSGATGPVAITEVSLPRALRDHIGLQPPSGFVAQPLPLTQEELRDPEAVAHAERYNRETTRYVGALTVPANGSAMLTFQVNRKDGSGVIRLQYERKVGLGGSIGFASVQVGSP